jgi:hypothetical protein
MRLPQFIGVGPTRTGTSWLHEVLKEHAGLPRIKETHFFNSYYEKGLSWYSEHFQDYPVDLPLGEICPVYFRSTKARERIAQDIPHCKIICSLRDPVDRLYSDYRLELSLGGEEKSLEETIKTSPHILEACCYAKHVRAWQDQFGRENVLVIFYDDFKSNPQGYIDSVCKFIGIPLINLTRSQVGTHRVNSTVARRAPRSRRLAQAALRLHFWLQGKKFTTIHHLWQKSPLWEFCVGGGKPYGPLPAETEARFREYFQSDIEALESLTRRDLSSWKNPIAAQSSAHHSVV